jgi:hypothetical protein
MAESSIRTASRRFAAPSLRQALDTCFSTVLGARPICLAISLLPRCWEISMIHSRSRGVSVATNSV